MTISNTGPAIALLSSRFSGDYQAFLTLSRLLSPVEMLDSAVALAGHLAAHTAGNLTVTSTGEPITRDADGGLWQVLSFAASLDHDPTPDDPIIAATTCVYRARDAFLTTLASSLADTIPDSQGVSGAVVVFWEGWDGEDWPEVLYGIGTALQRLFLLAGLPDLEDSDDTNATTTDLIDWLRSDVIQRLR